MRGTHSCFCVHLPRIAVEVPTGVTWVQPINWSQPACLWSRALNAVDLTNWIPGGYLSRRGLQIRRLFFFVVAMTLCYTWQVDNTNQRLLLGHWKHYPGHKTERVTTTIGLENKTHERGIMSGIRGSVNLLRVAVRSQIVSKANLSHKPAKHHLSVGVSRLHAEGCCALSLSRVRPFATNPCYLFRFQTLVCLVRLYQRQLI